MALAIGVMTGTSLDAIDVSLCEIDDSSAQPTIALKAFSSTDYSDECLALIRRAISNTANTAELSELQFLLAREYAAAINNVRGSADPSTILCVGAHGQTVWHNPPLCTWQMVNGSVLAQLTGIPVVCDFRSADVALGGQGAPLVPMFDAMFLSHNVANRAVVNIGGMSNVTLLPANVASQDIRAFDCGPGNVLIDIACRYTFGKRYDDEGKIARAGLVIPSLFQRLSQLDYFLLDPPKSTGRELFNEDFAKTCIQKFAHPSAPSEDIIATFTELTAWCITNHIDRYGKGTTEIIVSGGGTKNTYLMERIGALMPGLRVCVSDEFGVPSQAKESMCFAFLATRTMNHLPGNLPSVTGASRPAILGSITFP